MSKKKQMLKDAMEKFTGRPEDDRVVKRHAVHERQTFFKKSPGPEIYDESKVTRQTGKEQIDDMVRSGQVRSKELKVKGGNRDTVYWSKGAAKPGKETAAHGMTKYIIETDAKVGDLKRPLSLDEVKVKTQTKPGVWEDVTDEIKKANKAFRSKLTNPKTAALRRAAAGDAAAAGPASAKQFMDDSVAYGRMGTAGAGLPLGATRTGPVRPSAY